MSVRPEWISGNIFIRPHQALDVGYVLEGHKHNFDHTTIVFRGAVHVKATLPNGTIVERDFVAPSHFLVRAEVLHEITTTEPSTEFWCVYSHRDPQGRVTVDYDGWDQAYQ